MLTYPPNSFGLFSFKMYDPLLHKPIHMLAGSQREKYKLPSFQIREGPTVNVDVTAPGSTLALGMLYMKSGNTEVAKWFEPPATHYLLNHVRPDLLLLRVIARGNVNLITSLTTSNNTRNKEPF